ncbi:Acetamidase [Talaromyces pinophilus]|nr:Acetamidase [Talaromyces pinophilus]
MTNHFPPWQNTARAKQQAILDAIPPKWRIQGSISPVSEVADVTGDYIQQFLSPREIAITNADAVVITEHTTSGKWSSVEVTEAFCHRAAIAHQLVNCLHEIFFDAAIIAARKLDAYFAEKGRPVGPLHGLPVSLKDQFHVPGVETTMGYVGWIGTFEGQRGDCRAKTFKSELVQELQTLGAVLFCKTSVPATLMAGETVNHIVGYTCNPKNRHLSAGGSSGGEGALIALQGSPAGFGTDIGGSIRVPAVFNGLFGLRPSAGRMPYEGAANSMDGQNTILSVIGPMARSVSSLRLLFRAVLSEKPWLHDPLVLELPWRDSIELDLRSQIESNREVLTFGVMLHDGFVQPHPPVQRAIKMVVDTFNRLGHRTIEWHPPSHQEALEIATTAFSLDGGEDILSQLALSGETLLPQSFIKSGTQKNASQVAALNVRKRQYQKAYLEYWNSTTQLTSTGRPVDAIICPVAAQAAIIPGHFRDVGYTTFVSVLDYTSMVIPVTHVDKNLDRNPVQAKYLSELDKLVASDYDAVVFDGAPVGIQLVGRRLQEEKILTLAEYIVSNMNL